MIDTSQKKPLLTHFYCENGAFHDEACCGTCWNTHPKATRGQMFLGSPEQREIEHEAFVGKAVAAGFTEKQAEFMFKCI